LTEVLGFEGGEKTRRVQRTKEELHDKIGLLHDCVRRIPAMLKEVGFEPTQAFAESVNGYDNASGASASNSTRAELEFEYAVKDRCLPLSPLSPVDSIAYMAAKNSSKVHRSLTDAFIRHGWKREEIDEMMDEMEKEWEESAGTDRQCVVRIVTFVGRKPLST
jgi:hypothetical protein